MKKKVKDMGFWECFWYVYEGVLLSGAGSLQSAYAALYSAAWERRSSTLEVDT